MKGDDLEAQIAELRALVIRLETALLKEHGASATSAPAPTTQQPAMGGMRDMSMGDAQGMSMGGMQGMSMGGKQGMSMGGGGGSPAPILNERTKRMSCREIVGLKSELATKAWVDFRHEK